MEGLECLSLVEGKRSPLHAHDARSMSDGVHIISCSASLTRDLIDRGHLGKEYVSLLLVKAILAIWHLHLIPI